MMYLNMFVNPTFSRLFSALIIAGLGVILVLCCPLWWQCFCIWILFACVLGEWIYACFFHPDKKIKTSLLFYATGVFYLLYAFCSLYALLIKPHGSLWIFLTATLVSLTDIGAFYGGRYFGGPKLFPSISPHKTWSGLFSGWALAFCSGWFLFPFIFGDRFSWSAQVLYLCVILVLAPLGDALESMVKRHLAIKDMSQLIPGHGGLLDRLDSHLIVFIAIDLLCIFNAFWKENLGY